MLPDQKTVEAIFRTVQALNARERTTKGALVTSGLFSLENFLMLWIPLGLLLVAIAFAFGYQCLPFPWVVHGAFIALCLAHLSVIVGSFWSIVGSFWSEARPIYQKGYLGVRVGHAAEWGERDAPHVHALSQYPRDALQYVLVEMKAERAAWERRVGTVVGAQEKIGIIPGLVGLVAGLARFVDLNSPSVRSPWVYSPWVLGLAFATLIVYLLGIWSHQQMANMDRVILLLEMVIAALSVPEVPAPFDLC